MENDKETKLRHQLIDFIRANSADHSQTNFEYHSVTALTILKAEIDARLADEKRQKKK